MNSLDRQNTEVLARYLAEVSRNPAGAPEDNLDVAEKQLHQNLFDETGPMSWITPAQVQARMQERINKREEGK